MHTTVNCTNLLECVMCHMNHGQWTHSLIALWLHTGCGRRGTMKICNNGKLRKKVIENWTDNELWISNRFIYKWAAMVNFLRLTWKVIFPKTVAFSFYEREAAPKTCISQKNGNLSIEWSWPLGCKALITLQQQDNFSKKPPF